MNKLIGLLVVFAVVSCSPVNKYAESISISGEVNYSNEGYIYLELLTPDGYKKVDSTRLKNDNSFLMRVVEGKDEIYKIKFFDIQSNSFALTNQNVFIKADGNSAFGDFVGKGTKEIEAISEAYRLQLDYLQRSGILRENIKKGERIGDVEALDSLRQNHQNLESQFYDELKELIRYQHGNLAACHLLVEFFIIEQELALYDEQIPILKGNLGDHWYLKQLIDNYTNANKVVEGSVAPDFSLPDPEGKLVKLSSFRGKYLFLDFWASWCHPCRIENPELVRVYQKYRDQNFEMLGISLDKKKEKWMEAIQKDGLDWPQVSDLKYFDSDMIELYNIENVPMTFLLDPEGKIIVKNIHTSELDSILGGLL